LDPNTLNGLSMHVTPHALNTLQQLIKLLILVRDT